MVVPTHLASLVHIIPSLSAATASPRRCCIRYGKQAGSANQLHQAQVRLMNLHFFPKGHSRFYWHVAALRVINEVLLATRQVVPEWLYKPGYLEVSRTAKQKLCRVSPNRPEPVVRGSVCIAAIRLELWHCSLPWVAVLQDRIAEVVSFLKNELDQHMGVWSSIFPRESGFAAGQEAG